MQIVHDVMEERKVPISEVIKRASSISDVADRLEVSRPTLYKYMDFYDNGEYTRIPDDVLAYFGAISGGTSADGADPVPSVGGRMRSEQALAEASMGKYLDLLSHMAADDRSRRHRNASLSWSEGPVQTMCVPNGRGATVFFKGALDGTVRTTVVVSMTVDGESTPIGRYVPDEGMGFVSIDNLPAGMAYTYRVEQVRGGETRLSEPGQLSLR